MVSKLGSMFSMEEDEWSADYVFRRLHGMIYLTAPGDPYRPVCTALKENDDQLSSRLTIILRQIAQWEFLRSFRAPGEIDDSFYKSLRIEYSTGPGNMPYKFLRSNAGIKVNYEKKDNKWIAAIRVRLTNTSDVDLYCACLYLSSDFGSYSKFLAEPVTRIEPGRSIDLRFKGDTRIPLGFDPVMKWYNKNSNSDCFQFLVSEELFDTSFLDFKPLPGPAIPQKFKNRSERNAVTFSLRIPSQKKNRWFSRRVDMEIYNPEYNSIQPLELEAMLEDPETSCFAQGLYLRKAKDKYELKKSIRQEETNAAALERIIDQYNTAQPAKDRIIC